MNDDRVKDLFAACDKGDVAVVRELATAANLQAKNTSGRSPLHVAVRENHLNVAELLLELGASIEALDNFDHLPLHEACEESKNSQLVALLLKADKKGVTVNAKTKKGMTPLHFAASNGPLESVSLLIAAGAEVDALNSGKSTPLALAASSKWTEDPRGICSLLIEKGAQVDCRDSLGSTPLARAAYNGITEAAKILLEKGASKTIKDNYGKVPSEVARKEKHYDLAKLLE